MRIISGKYKEALSPPKELHRSPTTDMSKEALFNVSITILVLKD
jgi:16S rRNA G966 N2-methylase RsmD